MTTFNDRRSFHGSTFDIPVGGELLPSAKTGVENFDYDEFNDADDRRNSVFFHQGTIGRGFGKLSPETRAWTWAKHGTNNQGKRAVVYEVAPQGTQRPDTIDGAHMAPSAKVLRRIDIPDEDAALWHSGDKNWSPVPGGVQGTLPGVNWNDYAKKTNYRELDAQRSNEIAEGIRQRTQQRRGDLNQMQFWPKYQVMG